MKKIKRTTLLLGVLLFSGSILSSCLAYEESQEGTGSMSMDEDVFLLLLLMDGVSSSSGFTYGTWRYPSSSSTTNGACALKSKYYEYDRTINGYTVCAVAVPEYWCINDYQQTYFEDYAFSSSSGSTVASASDSNLCYKNGFTYDCGYYNGYFQCFSGNQTGTKNQSLDSQTNVNSTGTLQPGATLQ